jgi:hypothetical protein
MTGTFIPLWILGGPFLGVLILAFSFKGASAMQGGIGERTGNQGPIKRQAAVPY